MALVPFRSRGPAAAQDAEERLIQVGGLALVIRQQPGASRGQEHPPPRGDSRWTGRGGADQHALDWVEHFDPQPGGEKRPNEAPAAPSASDHLGSVGLVAWQCGFLLADHLLRYPPCGCGGWCDMRVIE